MTTQRVIDALSDDPELDTYSSAEDILKFAIHRVRKERQAQEEYRTDLIESLRICELLISEATIAEDALESLLAGDIYANGDSINARWDNYAEGLARDLAPKLEQASPEPEPEPDAEAEPLALPAPEVEAQPPPVEPEPFAPAQPTPPNAGTQAERVLAAIVRLAGDEGVVSISLKDLAAESGVPAGSMGFAMEGVIDSGRVDIIKAKHPNGSPKPHTYRLRGVVARAEPSVEEIEPAPAPAPPPPPMQASPERPAPPPKGPARVTEASSLVDRIAHTLRTAAASTSGLASMLDVKELMICQTLSAMEHEKLVVADAMPEAGRRAQLWRLAQ